MILKFAGYGFNKSHSTGYAILAYQTAYLKTYFPVQYMAAVLTYEAVSTDKVVEYIDGCRRLLLPGTAKRGVDVKPPDINLSDIGFTVVYSPDEPHNADHGHIRFGLSAVKGVGEKAIRAIIETRGKSAPFKSLYDFTDRVPLGSVNRTTIDALIKCGAFDTLHSPDSRAAMIEALEAAIQAGQRAAIDRDAGQMNFFESLAQTSPNDDAPDTHTEVKLPSIPPWHTNELLKHEKSVLGFYVSSHPLDQHHDTIDRFTNTSIDDIHDLPADTQVILGGILTRIRPTLVKKGRSAGQKMAMITIEDRIQSIDGVVFSDAYAIASPLMELDRVVLIKGKVDRRREEPSIVIDQVIPLEQAAEHLTQAVMISITDSRANGDDQTLNGGLAKLKTMFRQIPTTTHTALAQVFIEARQNNRIIQLRLNGQRIAVDAELPSRIETILRSPGCCQLIGPTKLSGSQSDSTGGIKTPRNATAPHAVFPKSTIIAASDENQSPVATLS